jgi:hypothetical protein
MKTPAGEGCAGGSWLTADAELIRDVSICQARLVEIRLLSTANQFSGFLRICVAQLFSNGSDPLVRSLGQGIGFLGSDFSGLQRIPGSPKYTSRFTCGHTFDACYPLRDSDSRLSCLAYRLPRSGLMILILIPGSTDTRRQHRRGCG